MNDPLVERYAHGADALGNAIAGLTREELNALPVPGTWSIQQIVLHLMDSDLISSDRMKRVIAEENPTLIGFDESAFARGLFYEALDAGLAADLFAKNRRLTAEILRRVPDEAFDRFGTHSERGRVTLTQLVQGMVDHLERHLRFLREKRRLLGKPL
ncbi:MAG TPA: DinB family protein [Pirellulales bacterium]|jgi:uncharacterized damage-inducible protein DinB|nr:DinB family protein [Pirellulales bacterium]